MTGWFEILLFSSSKIGTKIVHIIIKSVSIQIFIQNTVRRHFNGITVSFGININIPVHRSKRLSARQKG